jgi:16S rRNA processing protein RimM
VIALGRVLRPYGLKGEFSVALLTASVDRFTEVGEIFIGAHGGGERLEGFAVLSARLVGSKPVLKLQGIDSRDAVAPLRGKYLLVHDHQEAPLPPGEYYEHHILGCRVVDNNGQDLGTITEILPMPAQDVYVVQSDERTWWLPAARELFEEIDIERKLISVRMINGLLETGPAN